MSRSDDDVKRARFGTGSSAKKRVRTKANSKRRQRDRASTALWGAQGPTLPGAGPDLEKPL